MLYWGQIKSVRYRDEILRPVAVPLVQQRNLILQQDNARPHVARVCQDFLANNNIAPLAWPPYSPDLTPIEHMWDELDRRVRKRRNPPATLAQLRNALIDEWNNIPMRTVNALPLTLSKGELGYLRQLYTRDTPDIHVKIDFALQDKRGTYQLNFNNSSLVDHKTNEILNFCSIHDKRFGILVNDLT